MGNTKKRNLNEDREPMSNPTGAREKQGGSQEREQEREMERERQGQSGSQSGNRTGGQGGRRDDR